MSKLKRSISMMLRKSTENRRKPYRSNLTQNKLNMGIENHLESLVVGLGKSKAIYTFPHERIERELEEIQTRVKEKVAQMEKERDDKDEQKALVNFVFERTPSPYVDVLRIVEEVIQDMRTEDDDWMIIA